MSVTILQGDCIEEMRKLPSGSVNCCVTSPPYWGLRSYLRRSSPLKVHEIGQERTPGQYVENLVAVFAEVYRVLRDDGTLWLNIDDCYYSGDRGGYRTDSHRSDKSTMQITNSGSLIGEVAPNRMPQEGLKKKELVGIPWMVAFALRNSGWVLRSDNIWSQPNPMPESVTDRPTRSHEYVFLFSKSKRYYYDQKAIEEPQNENERTRRLKEQAKGLDTVYNLRRDGTNGQHVQGKSGVARSVEARQRLAQKGTRNKRTVWTIPTFQYRGAHTATFPPALIRPCILAGCPKGGTVLDCFGGSGTTGEVSEEEGRNSILIELNPEYVGLAEGRTAQAGLLHHT